MVKHCDKPGNHVNIKLRVNHGNCGYKQNINISLENVKLIEFTKILRLGSQEVGKFKCTKLFLKQGVSTVKI